MRGLTAKLMIKVSVDVRADTGAADVSVGTSALAPQPILDVRVNVAIRVEHSQNVEVVAVQHRGDVSVSAVVIN